MPTRLVSLFVLFAAALAVLGSPAQAHGPVSLVDASAQLRGGATDVRAVISYLDGDPNGTSAISATARSGSRSVTIPMAKAGQPGVFSGRAVLPAGRWELTVRASGASKGSGRATVTVPAPSSPIPWLPLSGGLAVLALIGAAALTVTRRRTPAAA
ncbi:MAG: hypothetical protein QOI35_2723 [Cryptosporangiaceae bacterium]|jgi:hypothetical protein|nr:hypothetical protein [Cryptosporangiaceae bacterium]MDQ1658080.1 hypothetical protein [Cryptosporangiaceae bacterium]